MNTKKYTKGMTLEQFIYCNYGFSVTTEQKRTAFSDYIKLSTNAKENI